MEKKGHNPLDQNELRTEWQFLAFSVLLQREAHCLCIIIRMDLRSLKCERLFNLSHSFLVYRPFATLFCRFHSAFAIMKP